MRNYLKFILLFSITAFLFQSCSEKENNTNHNEETATNEKTVAKDVSASEFKELIHSGKGILVDVRTPGEYAGGHIEDAKLIDFTAPSFTEEIQTLDKNQPVYLYCASGGRSGQAMNMMKDMGFKEVYNLKGGYNGYPK